MRARRRHNARHAISIVGLIALIGGTTLATVAPAAYAAQPVPGHSELVPDRVRTDTPRITSGEVTDIEVLGNRAFIAGTFTSIRDWNGTAVAQPYLAAFDINTGRLDMGFRPSIDGSVAAVEASPDGSALYIAGRFNTVNGVTKRKIARINPTTGATVTGFTAQLDARATSLAVSDNWVYVGGFFARVNSTNRGRLAAVNRTTGAADPGFNLPVTEGIGNGGTLKVVQLQLTTDESTLLVVHTGRNVAGQQRIGMALIDTAAKSLRPWNTNLYADYLPITGGVVRLANGDISPDNSYFVVVSGGGGDRPPVSDTAVAFPIDGGANPSDVEPLWVSRLFDSAYGVAVTEVAVYLAGHFRYLEAPGSTQPWPGLDTQNYGWGESLGAGVLGDEVVRRDMLGAVDPVTGTALEWNPSAEAALGHGHLEAVPRGLLVGMDSSVIGGQSIGRFGFFDFDSVPPPSAAETWVDYPYEGATVAGGGAFTFEGRASATSQVARVQLEIRNRVSLRYLQDDGVTWSSTWNGINTTLAATDQTETTWTYTSPSFPAGSFIVYARAFAENGSRDSTKATKKFESIIVDNAAPDSYILGPTGTITTNTFVLEGVSYDDEAVVSVSINVRDTSTDLYLQDDGTFSGDLNNFQADLLTPNEPTVYWELELTLPDGEYRLNVVARDNEGQSEHVGLARRLTVSTGGNLAPAVTLDTLVSGTIVTPGTQLVLAGTASDDVSVRKIEVSVRNNNTTQGVQIDGTWGAVPAYYQITPPNTDAQTLPYSYTTPPLPIGSYTIRVRATDNTDTRTPTTATPPSTIAQPNVSVIVGTAGDALPNTTLDFASSTQDYDLLTLPITGTATDDLGVSSVKLVVYNSTTREYLTNTAGATSFFYTLVDTPVASPGATSTTFASTFTLPEPGNYRITAVAVDTMGQYDGSTAGATATYLIFPGDADPTLVLDLQTPVNGNTYTNFIPVGGRATDDNGISRVSVRVQSATTLLYLRSDGTLGASQNLTAYLTNPGGAGSNFSYTTPTLPPDDYVVTVWPTDNVGQIMLVPYTATVTVVAG